MKNLNANNCILLLSLIVFTGCDSEAQVKNLNTNECNCSTAYIDMIEKLENNYIGLAQMQLSGVGKAYNERKFNYKKKVQDVLPENCTEFLQDFLSFFKDGHLSVFERPNYTESESLKFKNKIKNSRLTLDSLRQMLSSQKAMSETDEHNKIIGVWTDGESEFIILNVDDKYHAYIINTKKQGIDVGELKAQFRPIAEGYSCTYYAYDYSQRFMQTNVFKQGTLLAAGSTLWKKSASSIISDIGSGNISDPKLPSIEKVDDDHTLITIPSFLVDYNIFKDFIKDNEKTIKNSTSVIVDIRGNRGGNGIYFPLIELYATQNMEGSQGHVLASNDNLEYFKFQQKNSSKIFKPVVKRIQENVGEIVDGPSYPVKKFKRKKSKIQHVAILTDNGCMSAAESFILHSKKASTKVKTFGGPTAGVIDYTSVNALLLDSGKQYIYFGYPTSTLHKEIPENGYNQTGILPDVPIKIESNDKINFIVNYFKSRISDN